MAKLAKFKLSLAALLFSTMTAFAGMPEFAEPAKEASLRWRKVQIPITFSNSLLKQNTSIRPDSDVQGAVRRSLEVWESVANIDFQVVWSDKQSVSPTGNAGDGTSLVTIAQTPENLLLFGGDSSDISARTRVFFNRRGDISEADIVLNPYQQFSTDGSIGTFDLESTLTHEIGHLLGLEHSSVIGATMNELQAKNGTFNLSGFSQRTLSRDDIAQVRAIYGAKDEESCCGALDGKITFSNPKSAKSLSVWLEENETGRVAISGKTGADGSFNFRGLNEGGYRLYAQDIATNFAGQYLGDVEIVKGKTAAFIKRISNIAKDFDVQFTGLNGQLGKLAIPVNSGKTYQIYVGGKHLNAEDFKIGITSPFFTVSAGSVTDLDYGKDISVFTFEIKSAAETPEGDYTLYLQKSDGGLEFITGAISIEKFSNQWNVPVVD